MNINPGNEWRFTLFSICLFVLFGHFTPSFGQDPGYPAQAQKDWGFEGLRNSARYAMKIAEATASSILNPKLTIPYFTGPLYKDIPHVYANTPLGHLKFNSEMRDKLVTAAKTNPHGLATAWLGPYPVVYVTNPKTRLKVMNEKEIGINNQAALDHSQWTFGGNGIKQNFINFMLIDSPDYKVQRQFLQSRFFGEVNKRLPTVEEKTSEYLKGYCDDRGQEPVPLRDFITSLVLNTSSHLLGLGDKTMDCGYFEDKDLQEALGNIIYGISHYKNSDIEDKYERIFLKFFKDNFDQISKGTYKDNFVRNIFHSIAQRYPQNENDDLYPGFDDKFPENFEDIDRIPKDFLRQISLTFAAVGLGAMVHSTANTLDWAMARLLAPENADQLNRLTRLMEENKNLNLSDSKIYDKDGPLFELGEYVMNNVYLYPAFTHKYYFNQKPYTVNLSEGEEENAGNEGSEGPKSIEIPSMSYIIINFRQCNLEQENLASANTFCHSFENDSPDGKEKNLTVVNFILDKRNSTFGGTERGKTRRCPGARISLLEQMIMMATMLRDYTLEVPSPGEISCDMDDRVHPLCSRLNQGDIRIFPKNK